ncbi:MAG: HAD-IC family P-type ATPase [Nanoarchaeota archaeon]
MQFYKLDKKEVFRFLESNENGLTSEEVNSRLNKYGLNELKKKKENKALKILFEQINSFVVYILIAAMSISFIVKEYLDGIVIGAIIVLNTILGFLQEYKAEKAIQSLKKLESGQTLVIRNNNHIIIQSKTLVPGDIILLEAGSKIPADCYLLEAYDLKVDESILTGESVSVKKLVQVIKDDSQIADQINMLFSSTNVVSGRAKAVVIKTAMETELGKIANIIQEEEEEETPLQKKLSALGKTLGISVILIAIIILITGFFEGEKLSNMLLIAISLAVAAVPEGLPAVVTISLALGVQRMVKKNVLVRKLSSVETLGSTTVICVPGDTTIICKDGIKNIESIKEKDVVLGADGNFHNVTKTFRRNYSGEVVHIKPIGLPLIKITPEHPILVAKFKDHRYLVHIGSNMVRPREREVLEAEWVAAKEINENDLVLIPKIKNEEIATINFRKGRFREETKLVLDEEIAEIFGWYLAEGCTYSHKGHYGVKFYLGKYEEENVKRLKDLIERKLGLKVYIYETQTSISLQFINQDLAVLFKDIFGDNAINKRIPTIILNSPKNIIYKFLQGYLKGDGNISDYYIRFTTSSKTLSYQLIIILAKLGIRGRLYLEKPRVNYIKGRELIKKESYTVFVSGTQAEVINLVKNPITEEKNNLFLSDENFVYVPIRYVKIEQESLEVFNIETDSQTYALPFIVHNCADKTGTITQNKMTVTKIFVDNKILDVNENSKNKDLMLKIISNCNDSKLPNIGDPTELALLRINPQIEIYPRIDEIPFSSERKYMITHHNINNKIMTFAKFAPEKILELCSYINLNGKITKFTNEKKASVLKINEDLAKNALRLLGCAYSEGKKTKDLIFVGLVGMIDPPRPEVRDSIETCRKAGIKVVMITGDHKLTAQAIARNIGLNDRAITGQELDEMSEEQLEDVCNDINIYARVNPEHKVRILNALKKKGNVVAMTGDGINDAPALKKSDIGIAVGAGTDVAKEASNMILLDNNFHSIVKAVEEGRGIYDNIKRFVNYLLSSNFGEVLILFTAILIGFRDKLGNIALPLGALELLWINLVTDGLPALALGIDAIPKDIMHRKPRKPKEHIVSRTMAYNIILTSVLMTLIVLFLFSKYLPENLLKAQTVAFTTIVMLEMFRVLMIRSQYKLKLFSNKWLILAILTSILLQLMVIYIPSLDKIFDTVPLGLIEWIYIISGCMIMFIVGTFGNLIIKRFTKELD